MTQTELEKLRAAAKREYKAAIEEARRRYRQALASIEGVARLQDRLARPKRPRGRAPGTRLEHGIAAAVLKIIPQLPGQFTVSMIEERLKAAGHEAANRASIATAIRRLMAERNDINVVVEGRGRRAAVYELVAK